MLNSTDPYVILLTILITFTCGLFIWFATPRDDIRHVLQIRYFSHFFFFTSFTWSFIFIRSGSWEQWNIFSTHLTFLLSLLFLMNGFRIRANQKAISMLWLSALSVLFALVQSTILSDEQGDFLLRLAMTYISWFVISYYVYRSLTLERNSMGKTAATISVFFSVITLIVGAVLIHFGWLVRYEYAVFSYCIFYITLFGSISSLMLSDEVAKHQNDAETDPLTGLKNRRFFLERGGKLLNSGRRTDFPMSIILCDIDHFKQINDTYGHSTGDIAIKKSTKILSDNVRDHDLLARFGGEEFIALLPQTDLQAAMDVAERMRKRIEDKEIFVPNSSFRLTSSFGVVEMIGIDLEANIARADRALYMAKSRGRNRVEIAED